MKRKTSGGNAIRKRNNVIGVRLSDEELEELNIKAEKAGLLRGEFIRLAVNGAVFKEIPMDNYTELLKAVKQVGSRLDLVLKQNRGDEKYTNLLNEALSENYKTEKMLWNTFSPGKS